MHRTVYWAIGFAVIALQVGCSNGPNDPSYSAAQINKMRASVVKPSDGAGPTGGPPGGGKMRR
jgi:hypothetical protein